MIPDCDLPLDLSAANDNVDKPEEACGVFGIYAPGQEVAKLTYFGLYALQHRGQESAGIATFDGRQLHEHRDMGLVSQVFRGVAWAAGDRTYALFDYRIESAL
jgi:amidophosphoribosyltransferase